MTHAATGRLAAFVLEGGGAVAPLTARITAVRDAMTLDLLERLRDADLGGPIVLATDRPDLAATAAASGLIVHPTDATFAFGTTLQQLVERWAAPPITGVVCLGGAAAPLATPADWRRGLTGLLTANPEPHVLANNPQSPDIVAFTPPHAAQRLGPVASDNALAWALRERAGLPRLLLPPTPTFTFDVDTPIDAIVLHTAAVAGVAPVGPRTRKALEAFAGHPDASAATAATNGLLQALQRPLSEIALVGRVGTPAIDHVNKLLRVRLRVFSEERGMKGLGREERGEVQSLLGHLIDGVGADQFFAHLTDVCTAALIDVRVLLGHWRLQLDDDDRFRLDLLNSRSADARLAAFMAAAQQHANGGYPLLIGGHSLVSGGLQLLADAAAAHSGVTTATQAAAGKAGFASEMRNGVNR